MAEAEKPSLSNRVIIVIFVVLAIATIGVTIYATTSEWDAVDADPLPAEETVNEEEAEPETAQ